MTAVARERKQFSYTRIARYAFLPQRGSSAASLMRRAPGGSRSWWRVFPLCTSPRHLSLRKRACARLVLVLACLLWLGAFNGHVGHDIPRIVDPHEQEQHRHRRDDEQARSGVDWKQNRRYDEGGVGDEWQERVPQPARAHQLIAHQTVTHLPEHDEDVSHPPRPARPSSKAAVQSASQGALRSAAISSAIPK